MKSRNVLIATIAAAAGCFSLIAQGPAAEEIRIKLDRAVQVGSSTLSPGDYTIRQVTSASNPRVLEFTSDNGVKLDATVTAIPVMQNDAPTTTRLIIQDEGGGARLQRIWVQGKNYGYEFPGTTQPGTRTATASARLEGTYTADRPVIAENTQPAPTPAPQPAPEPAPAPAPAPAAAAPAPTPEPAPAQAAPAPEPAPAPAMPATALGWVEMLMAGLVLFTCAAAVHVFSSRGVRKSA